jgi:hypothetical protein
MGLDKYGGTPERIFDLRFAICDLKMGGDAGLTGETLTQNSHLCARRSKDKSQDPLGSALTVCADVNVT